MKKKRNDKKQKRDSKQLKFYFFLLLIGMLLYLSNKQLAITLLMFPIGIIVGIQTTKMSKIVPSVTIETMTCMSIFGGMLFGPMYGFIFGLSVGLGVYAMLGLVKMTTIVNSLVISSGGLYAGLLAPFIINPSTLFLCALLLRTLSGIIIFKTITGSIDFEAVIHAVLDPLWNLFFYMPVIVFLYTLII